MTTTKKTLKLGKIKQLIDLNGDSTNFDLTFNVVCKDDTPFKVLVVDQTTLDNTPELQYKETSKTISGNIVADKNVYQNYFLILKADKECEVDVELTKKLLPKTPDTEMDLPFDTPDDQYNTRLHQTVSTGDSSSLPWKKIGLIALVVVIGLGVLWWLYKRKKDPDQSIPPLKTAYAFVPEHMEVTGSQHGFDQGSVRSSHQGSDHGSVHGSVRSSGKRASPEFSSRDNRGFKPVTKSRVSPDIMSQTSRRSSVHGDDGNSLLNRLRKFAR